MVNTDSTSITFVRTRKNQPGQPVQIKRKALEDLAGLATRKPKAAALLHRLIARMDSKNTVVVSQETLSKLVGCSLKTIQFVIAVLVEEDWISVEPSDLNSMAAYVVNDRIVR